MSETQSNALLIVIATIITCLVMTALFYSKNAHSKLVDTGITAGQEMDVSNRKTELEKYIGSTIDGYKLQAFLQTCDGQDIAVYVQNEKGTATFDFKHQKYTAEDDPDPFTKNRYDFYSLDTNGDHVLSDQEKSHAKSVTEMMRSAKYPYWYIAPRDQYACTANYSHGVISWLSFRRTA